ncbi:cache domain-containing sensor histidine kinase [Paenibacillus bouchesdurhonensis]|uniref:cache domain-containing sensor histidine kinase n=1 Tax=Paenibacillus bouchesdurhonensis TaxID=1870990 RepID=UPI000DA60495|nr:histidine kinase [Paenibacillus bouchesdurhonensis]
MPERKFKLRKIVNDIPLNYKFFLVFFIGVLLPIILMNLLFMDRMSHLIMSREEQNLEISLERARKDIHDYLDGGVAVSHALSRDRTLYEMLDQVYEDQLDFYVAFDEQLRHRVTSYMPVNNQIQRITIFTDNQSIVSGGNYQAINEEVMNSDWYKLWKKSNERVMVAAYQATNSSDKAYTSPYLSVIEKMDYIDHFDTYEKLLRIDIDLSKIYDVIVRERDYLNLYLVNEHNQIIMSSESGYQRGRLDPYPIFQLPKQYSEEDVHMVSIGTAKYVKGWRLIGLAEGTRITKAMLDMRLFIGAMAAAVTLTAALFIYVMLRSYNYRVKRLSRHMQKVSNEKFDLIQIDEGRDEIGGLIRNFNRMTTKINSLINNVYKLEIQKKSLDMERVRAELNFMQSQMNPHFLFNTLNAILVVCTKNNYSDVTDIIKSLSKLLRRLLSWKEDVVTLEEELMFIEMYLKIEKFRFREKFDYQFEIEEETLSYKIPKMSIQPLVENACKHGIQMIDGLGIVRISTAIRDGRLRIVIADNGKGMEAAKLREVILAVRNENSSGTSIGIRNVYRRLELYYDDQVRFDIASQPGLGTEISYEIPLRLLDHT